MTPCVFIAASPPNSKGERHLTCIHCGQISAPTKSTPDKMIATCSARSSDSERYVGVHLAQTTIEMPKGPGTELVRLLMSLGIKPKCCGHDRYTCAEVAREMDALGPAGVRAEKQKYVAHLNKAYSRLSTLELVAIASKISLPFAAGILWHGAAGYLIDLACQRAEAAV